MEPAEPMPPRAGSDRVSVATSDAVAPPAPAEGAPAAVTPAAPSPAVRSSADELSAALESLAGLRDKGLITPEEYEAKKRDLLERM
jgi:hypothetical protein